MKITILQQDLLPALQAVARSVSTKNDLPVLANILLQTENGKLKLAATNLEIGVIKLINAKIDEEGDITIPAKNLLEIVASLTGEEITLESQAEQLKISTRKFSGVLNGITATEFPTIPVSSEKTISLPSKILKKSVSEISFAAAVDEGRPVLTGILTEVKEKTLQLVATDGFRLAYKKTSLTDNVDSSLKTLIPRRTFEEVVRLIAEDLKDTDEIVEIGTSENQNQMVFKIGQTQLSSRLIEGQFPSWEKIIPQKFETRAVLEKVDVIKAVKLSSVFARSDANIVKIETTENSLKFRSEAKELGTQETSVDAQVEGGKINIAFNSKFLQDAVNACSSSQIVIEFSGNLSPALIKPMGEEGLEYIVMPIRLS
jgi:DNA polymerase III subunit beta